MATGSESIHIDGEPRANAQTDSASLRELLRQLADEGSNLVRGEIALAKLEIRQAVRDLALDMVKLGVALGLAAVGGLALTAALIVGVGSLLGGMYWLSALIVGFVLLAVGGLMAKRGIDGLKDHSVRPETTINSLQQDKRWARQEVSELKQRLTT